MTTLLQIDTWCTTTKAVVGIVISTALVVGTNHHWIKRKPIPGPRGLPIIGNMLQLPDDPLPLLKKWKENYGDVFKITVFGSPIVVLSGIEEMHEMFVVKSNGLKMYGDRLQTLEMITQEMIQGLVGEFESLNGKPFDCSHYYHKIIAEIIIGVVRIT